MADADDLYAGLALPARTKRATPSHTDAPDGNAVNASAATEQEQDPEQEQARAAKRHKAAALDLPATIAKLQGYMLVDKKFPKASTLFVQLMATAMNAQTQHLFFDAMHAMVAAKGAQWSGKAEFEALVQQFVAKYDPSLTADDDGDGPANTSGSRKRDDTAKALDDWQLLAVTHAQLFTDETYQFVKAAKVVKARLERVPASVHPSDDESLVASASSSSESALADELEVAMPLLRTLFRKHTTAWARTMVESVLALATQRRLRFSAAHRSEIDAWTSAIQERRSAPVVARTAASDARRNILAASSSEATVRVGRSNHPLFNKEQ